MAFANPLFLFGLIAIAVPIIIHLFNFRKFQKVYFTNVKFIEELKQQTQKQSQLKHLLVLLMRILAVAALVLAFAQPYIPVSDASTDQEVRNGVSIYVDNSFSMEAAADNGSLLDEALNTARQVALAYKTSDKFQLLTNDFEGRHQRFVSREDFLELLDEVEVSPITRKLSDVYVRQHEMLGTLGSGSKTVYFISDFQEVISDFENIVADTTTVAYALPIVAIAFDNLYIDSIWFDAPVYRVNQLAQLNVRIVNTSSESHEKAPVRLMINDVQRAIASFDIDADDKIIVKLPFTNNNTGLQYGSLEISDHPITFDDSFYFSFEVQNEIPVLAINSGEESAYLKSLFGKDSTFIFQNVAENRLEYSTFNQNNLIILNGLNMIPSGLSQELKRFAEGGGSIAVFPGTLADMESYREFFLNMESPWYAAKDTFQTRISKINLQSRLFDDVFESIPENMDLPVVKAYYPIQRQTSAMMEVLLETQNGEIFLGSEAVGRGSLYMFASPLDVEWTNLPKHAIFVPTMYKIALLSQPSNSLYFTTGKNESITIKSRGADGDRIFKIKRPGSDFEIIPETRSIGSQVNIYTGNQIKEAGNYSVNYDGEIVSALSFNYDRAESDLQNLGKADLNERFIDAGLENFSVLSTMQSRSLTTVITEMNTGVRLWKLFILLALTFLLGEVILLRIWK